MKNIAERIIPYAKNKIIHIDNIRDLAIKRILSDRRALKAVRKALRDIDPQLEVFYPGIRDSAENQLRRYIQYKYGIVVNLSVLYKEDSFRYNFLYRFGDSPAAVIKGWGLDVCYDIATTEKQMLESLNEYMKDGKLSANEIPEKLYQSLVYRARKESLSVKDYLDKRGITYLGGRIGKTFKLKTQKEKDRGKADNNGTL